MKAKYSNQTVAIMIVLVAAAVALLTFTDHTEIATTLIGLVALILGVAKMPVIPESKKDDDDATR